MLRDLLQLVRLRDMWIRVSERVSERAEVGGWVRAEWTEEGRRTPRRPANAYASAILVVGRLSTSERAFLTCFRTSLPHLVLQSHLAYLLYLPDLEAAYGPLLQRPYATAAATTTNGGGRAAGALRSVSSASSSIAGSFPPPTTRPHASSLSAAGPAPHPTAGHGSYGSSPAKGSTFSGNGGGGGLAAAALASSSAPYGLPAAAQRRLAAAWEALLHAEAASHVLGWLAGARAKRLPYGQLRERLGAEMPGAVRARLRGSVWGVWVG